MLDWQERTRLLIGEGDKLKHTHILLAGAGGVGGYVAEMLCRAGVGKLTIIDSDNINVTNINRQIIALNSTIGASKVEVLGKRLLDINPDVHLNLINEYITPDNVNSFFDKEYDYVVDAIDTLSPKVAFIKTCMDKGLPLVSSMGAGAKLDPSKIEIADISKSKYCPLAHQLRKRLSRLGIKKGFNVVFSSEIPIESAMVPCDEPNKKTMVGTISYLPAIFGCFCASVVIRDLS